MRTVRLYSLSDFQICNKLLLTIVAMLYITSHDLFILYLEICMFWLLSRPFPSPLCLWQPPVCSLYLWAQWTVCCCCFHFRFLHINEIIWYLSFSDLFYLMWCPQDPSMLSQMAPFLSFSWPNNVCVCVPQLLYLFICWWTVKLFLYLGCYK